MPCCHSPDESYSRAILFDPAKPHPEFVWLHSFMSPYGYLSSDYSSVKHALVDTTQSRLKDGDICDTIWIRYRNNFLSDSSEYNKAAANVCDGFSPYIHKWCGPILVSGTDRLYRNDQDPVSGRDLIPSDLRHVADFFNTYLYGNLADPCKLYPRAEFKKKRMARKEAIENKEVVTAVRINCEGDVTRDNRPRYEACRIPVTHSIFNQAPTDVSKQIELPILVRQIPGNVSTWQKRNDHSSSRSPWCNREATFLHIGCQPDREDDFPRYAWGLAPYTPWQDAVGSVIIARQDKKVLLPDHVAALANFCQHHLSPIFHLQLESSHNQDMVARRGKDFVLKEITKEKFEEYFQGWMTKQASQNGQTVSPYA